MAMAAWTWAQDVAAAAAPAAKGFGAQVMTILGPLLLTALAAASGIITKLLMDLKPEVIAWVKQRVKSSKLQGILGMLTDRAFSVVTETYQLTVKEALTRAQDGKLTKEDKAAIKKVAMDRLGLLVPRKVWNFLQDEGYNTGVLASAVIEEAVVRLKVVKKATAVGAPEVPKS